MYAGNNVLYIQFFPKIIIKRFDLIDKFNDTSLYLDDIFTIDNPAFAEHIPDIYPRELQLNKLFL